MTARVVRTSAPPAIERARALVLPALRASLDRLTDPRMRLVAGYQLGLWDAEGTPDASGGGKVIRPALALVAATAMSGAPDAGIPAAVAVELVHNFSLLHDDIMDRDVERRHRPTGWVAFGEGQAILAGNAMLTAAVEILVCDDPGSVPLLLETVQELIRGQSEDLALEGNDNAQISEVLEMEAGKTAALIAGSLAMGARAGGADGEVVRRVAAAGRLVGVAFQLVDDVLGVVGDSAVTGKSASSDVRAGKRSAVVVAALHSGRPAGARLAELLRAGAPESDADVARAVELIESAGGIEWASSEAERLLEQAHVQLDAANLPHADAVAELHEIADYLVRRNG